MAWIAGTSGTPKYPSNKSVIDSSSATNIPLDKELQLHACDGRPHWPNSTRSRNDYIVPCLQRNGGSTEIQLCKWSNPHLAFSDLRLAIKSASLEGELAHTKWMNEADKNSKVIIGRHELTNAVAFAVRLLSSTVHAIIQRTTLRELAQSSRIRLNDLHHICVVLGQAKRSWRLVFHQWSCWIEA